VGLYITTLLDLKVQKFPYIDVSEL